MVSPLDKMIEAMSSALTGPVIWFRENVVEPNRKVPYPWYHRQYRRVPTIDTCYMDDWVCREEANYQFRRDRLVDNQIVNLLNERYEDCIVYESPDSKYAKTDPNSKCYKIYQDWKEAQLNFYIKYGDLRWNARAEDVFMKQKHRLVWERRHGPVGSGMKEVE